MSKEKSLMWVKCDFNNDDVDDDFDDDDEDGEFEGSYSEDKPQSSPFRMMGLNIPTVIPTPFGPVSQDDSTNPMLDTEFFIGHTNFNLSKEILVDISKVEGVEFLKVMSRYRFIVGIGAMFDPDEVRVGIEVSMGVTSIDYDKIMEKSPQVANDSMRLIVDDIISKVPTNEKWLAYIFPNGEHIVKIVKNIEDINLVRNNFLELEKESHGLIVTSSEELNGLAFRDET